MCLDEICENVPWLSSSCSCTLDDQIDFIVECNDVILAFFHWTIQSCQLLLEQCNGGPRLNRNGCNQIAQHWQARFLIRRCVVHLKGNRADLCLEAQLDVILNRFVDESP